MKVTIIFLFFASISATAVGNIFGGTGGIGLFGGGLEALLNSLKDKPTSITQLGPQCRSKYSTLDPSRLWRLGNNQVYYFPTETLSYADAKAFCENKGLKLVTFQDLAESVFLREEVSRLYRIDPTWTDGYAWIGLDSIANTGLGVYRWLYTNTGLSFVDWCSGQPTTTNDCVYFNLYDQFTDTCWDTATACTETHNFVCEMVDFCDPFVYAQYQPFIGYP